MYLIRNKYVSVITGKENASETWNCMTWMLLTIFYIYFVFGYVCFTCVCFITAVWLI